MEWRFNQRGLNIARLANEASAVTLLNAHCSVPRLEMYARIWRALWNECPTNHTTVPVPARAVHGTIVIF